MTTVTRYVGTCPVCEGQYKLHKLKMVHHGYQRPGDGWIHGDCLGVGWAPFERSAAGAINYLDTALVPRLERLTDFLTRLKNGEVQELHQHVGYDSSGGWGSRIPKFKTLTPADGREFQDEVRSRIRATEREMEWVSKDITRFENKIEGWVEKPVRTEDDVVQVRERITSERRAVLEQARQVKRDKRAALDAKQAAREQEQLDLIQEYRDIFNKLAFEAEVNDVSGLAKKHWIAMHKRKNKKSYLHFYDYKLGIPEALVRLKLAVLRPRLGDGSDPRHFEYANDLAWEPRA